MEIAKTQEQHQRLIAAIKRIVARDGYADAKIAAIIADAGVSRATYYEHFVDKEDGFLAAVEDIRAQLHSDIQHAISETPAAQAAHATVNVLVEHARTEPEASQILLSESTAAGDRARDARDQSIIDATQLVESAYQQLEADESIPDLSPRMMIGGIHRILALRTRRGDLHQPELAGHLTGWVDSYKRPISQHRWRTQEPAPTFARIPYLAQTVLAAPTPFASRAGIPKEEIEQNNQQRLMFAAGEHAAEYGYHDTTITDISRDAGLDNRTFRKHYEDKQQAFTAYYDLHFQILAAIAAGAFFTAQSWPQRIWEAGRAYTQTLEENPTVAQVGFVQGNAVGRPLLQRIDDAYVAFTIFLQEGFECQRAAAPPTTSALEAIAAANFETVYQQVRAGTPLQLQTLLPHTTFLCIAPFLGVEEADREIHTAMDAAAVDS